MEFVLPTPRQVAMTFLVITVGAMVLMAAAAVFTSTPTNPPPSPSSTSNITIIDLAATDKTSYDNTGSPAPENETLSYSSAQDFVPNTPPMDIEEAIRRTNANLAERGDPILSKREECLARAVANRTDKQACNDM